MFVRDVQRLDGAVAHGLGLTPPQVEEAGMEERIGEREGMLELSRQSHGEVRTF